MVVAVVAAPIRSLLTRTSATGGARAGFPSAARSHSNGTATRAPDPSGCARSASERKIGCTGVALHRNDAQPPGTGSPRLRSRLAPSPWPCGASSHDRLRAWTERVSTATRKLRNVTHDLSIGRRFVRIVRERHAETPPGTTRPIDPPRRASRGRCWIEYSPVILSMGKSCGSQDVGQGENSSIPCSSWGAERDTIPQPLVPQISEPQSTDVHECPEFPQPCGSLVAPVHPRPG